MSRNGFFPLEQIVHIDPDYFKRVMPEWPEYCRQVPLEAGALCHQESGFIQEIAQEVALTSQQNIWIDGSLRNWRWYSRVLDDIRERHPNYRIAIFYVHCDEKLVYQRAERRAHVTGRHISFSVLKKSIEETRLSVRHLSPKADYVATIDNTTTPRLEAFETVDRSGRWSLISSRFGHATPVR